MSLHLTHNSEYFQHAHDVVLTNYKCETSLVELDDIIIYSNTFQKHICPIADIPYTLMDTYITLKRIKCQFPRKSVEFIGLIIEPRKLKIYRAHTGSSKKSLSPTNKAELRFHLRLFNRYSSFANNFENKPGSLNELQQKQVPKYVALTAERVAAFWNKIDIILSLPALNHQSAL